MLNTVLKWLDQQLPVATSDEMAMEWPKSEFSDVFLQRDTVHGLRVFCLPGTFRFT